MNAHDRKKDLKGAFDICEVTNNLINLKNSKVISSRELTLQLFNVIKICTESLTFLEMACMEGDNIKRQYLSKILPLKLLPLNNDVPTPSKLMLGNNLNDKISTIETS